ncbi:MULTISPECIES: ATP-binding protein [Hyphobacterium]|uniref:ATP-binding protein n=1 Tax=Hyphobacterium vulgare TaxID=1736751 RepID=A0ABV6ZX28_9PROT
MPIAIEPPSRQLLRSMDTRFALQRDDWNDYSFRTLYHLYYRPDGDASDVTYIGGVKILRKGQKAGPQLIQKPFNKLSEDWASVGTSLDYYQRLNELPTRHRKRIMDALNDVVAHPELVAVFQGEEGWEKSLFRDNYDWRGFLNDAQALYENNFSSLADISEAFTFTPAGVDEPIEFDFSSPEPANYFGPYRRVGPSRRGTLLPNRIFVLVGRNGSGKSTLLARLAHIAFASPLERSTKELKALGTLDPPSVGFMRIITISYSAFDSFVVPSLGAKDLSQMTQDLASGEGRFVFCGLRDLVAEARADIERDEEATSGGGDTKQPVERRTTTRLKPVEKLADEFAELVTRIRKEERVELLEAALEPLVNDPSFADLKDQMERLTSSSRSARSFFLGWSTGHKIALHVVASLVAHAMPRSLVLFDEPEAHLHPPLMAALMHAVRIVLTELNALCVVATHSPVLLQETLSRHVRRVRRTGTLLEIKKPVLETFGENVGVLTYDAFGLTASSTDYHKILDVLVTGCDTIDELDALFEPGLSAQARAYVLTQFARKK